MMEYPESVVIARQINSALVGKVVSLVAVEASPHRFAFYSPLKNDYAAALSGKTLKCALHYGGQVEVDFDDMMLTFNDGAMPRFCKNSSAYPKKHQLLIEFGDKSAISVTIAMYGGMMLYKKGECDSVYFKTAVETPDILSDEFSYDFFRSRYVPNGKKLSLKAFLATEQRFPGVGNGVIQDVCFASRLDPRSDMARLAEDDFHALHASLRQTLKKMCALGGRSTEKDLYGNYGGYSCVMQSANQNTPCPVCGAGIEKNTFMGGSIYTCPTCQIKK